MGQLVVAAVAVAVAVVVVVVAVGERKIHVLWPPGGPWPPG